MPGVLYPERTRARVVMKIRVVIPIRRHECRPDGASRALIGMKPGSVSIADLPAVW
jgi:hypothetical protein